MQFSPDAFDFICLGSEYSPQHSILKCCSHRVRDEVSHPHKIKAKITVVCTYILIITLLDMSGDTKDTE